MLNDKISTPILYQYYNNLDKTLLLGSTEGDLNVESAKLNMCTNCLTYRHWQQHDTPKREYTESTKTGASLYSILLTVKQYFIFLREWAYSEAMLYKYHL